MGVLASVFKCLTASIFPHRHERIFFSELGSHATFRNPRKTQSGRKATGSERKKEREIEKSPVIVATRFYLRRAIIVHLTTWPDWTLCALIPEHEQNLKTG